MAEQFDYNEAHDDAAELIEFFGQAGSVVKKGNSSGWDDSGNQIPVEPDTVINGIVTPKLDYDSSEVNGTSILMGDASVLFESNIQSEVPEIDMMITLNGDTFRIISIEELTSVDNINVYRELTIRK